MGLSPEITPLTSGAIPEKGMDPGICSHFFNIAGFFCTFSLIFQEIILLGLGGRLRSPASNSSVIM